MDIVDIWPPFGLKITAGTGNKEITLRAMRDEDIAAISAVTPQDIFGAEIPDHAFGWLFDAHNSSAQFRWLNRAQMSAKQWSLDLVVLCGDEIVGVVDMRAKEFAKTKTIGTGSWIYYNLQGQGFGTLVRRAIAEVSFNHFGAEKLTSAWASSNRASEAVSVKLGYEKIQDVTVESLGPDSHTAPGVKAALLRANYQQPKDVQFSVSRVTPELKTLLGI